MFSYFCTWYLKFSSLSLVIEIQLIFAYFDIAKFTCYFLWFICRVFGFFYIETENEGSFIFFFLTCILLRSFSCLLLGRTWSTKLNRTGEERFIFLLEYRRKWSEFLSVSVKLAEMFLRKFSLFLLYQQFAFISNVELFQKYSCIY